MHHIDTLFRYINITLVDKVKISPGSFVDLFFDPHHSDVSVDLPAFTENGTRHIHVSKEDGSFFFRSSISLCLQYAYQVNQAGIDNPVYQGDGLMVNSGYDSQQGLWIYSGHLAPSTSWEPLVSCMSESCFYKCRIYSDS